MLHKSNIIIIIKANALETVSVNKELIFNYFNSEHEAERHRYCRICHLCQKCVTVQEEYHGLPTTN